MTMYRIVFAMFLAAVVPLHSFGSEQAGQASPGKPKTVRLLTVGNSFSQNATRYLDSLAKAAGDTLIHRPLAIGGASMQVHWDKAQLHESDPNDDPRFHPSQISHVRGSDARAPPAVRVHRQVGERASVRRMRPQ